MRKTDSVLADFDRDTQPHLDSVLGIRFTHEERRAVELYCQRHGEGGMQKASPHCRAVLLAYIAGALIPAPARKPLPTPR